MAVPLSHSFYCSKGGLIDHHRQKGASVVCDQKTSKFLSHMEESMAEHKWGLLKVREGNCKGEHGGAQVEAGS
jgi:hypothetical protein